FLDRGNHDSAHKRIEPRPGWIINPCLKSAKRNAGIGGILRSKNRPEDDAAKKNRTRKNDGSTGPPEDDQQNKRKREIKLVFHRKRPGMRKRGTAVQRDVLQGEQKFPERLSHIGILAPQGQQKIDRENDKVGRQDPQSPACVESSQIQTVIARELREKLATDQISAKNKEKIYTDPALSVNATG